MFRKQQQFNGGGKGRNSHRNSSPGHFLDGEVQSPSAASGGTSVSPSSSSRKKKGRRKKKIQSQQHSRKKRRRGGRRSRPAAAAPVSHRRRKQFLLEQQLLHRASLTASRRKEEKELIFDEMTRRETDLAQFERAEKKKLELELRGPAGDAERIRIRDMLLAELKRKEEEIEEMRRQQQEGKKKKRNDGDDDDDETILSEETPQVDEEVEAGEVVDISQQRQEQQQQQQQQEAATARKKKKENRSYEELFAVVVSSSSSSSEEDNDSEEEEELPHSPHSSPKNDDDDIDDTDDDDELEDWELEFMEEEEQEKEVICVLAEAEPEGEAETQAAADRSSPPRKRRNKKKKKKTTPPTLRSPICCLLGHVDAGKTSILDHIRRSSVQAGEPGGITQQIGATYVPMNIQEEENTIPGLLLLDTPGHKAFSNLRARGSDLCDLAVVVVDVMDREIKPQTAEVIRGLLERRVPFVVAMNKIDRLNGWKWEGEEEEQEQEEEEQEKDISIRSILQRQGRLATEHFRERLGCLRGNLQSLGLNSNLFWNLKKKSDFQQWIAIVPTSARCSVGHQGGISDLLSLVGRLTKGLMKRRITFRTDRLRCSILESKFVPGYGHTIDVIVSNGILRESDMLVVCTLGGPVVCPIRCLLVPEPMAEIRVKAPSAFVRVPCVRASRGVKIASGGSSGSSGSDSLEGAVAGSRVFVVKNIRDTEEVERLKRKVMKDLNDVFGRISTSTGGGRGVFAQAPTLGSLEAFLEHLSENDIPVAGCSVGPVHRKDVVRASLMVEMGCPEYAAILAFAVKITREAREEARKSTVEIFEEDLIYRLSMEFLERQRVAEEGRIESLMESDEIIWPCVLRLRPQSGLIRRSDPIIVGVDVVEGILKPGMPICTTVVVSSDSAVDQVVDLGRVREIQSNGRTLDEATEGMDVAVSFGKKGQEFGRVVEWSSPLYSKITRGSIDVLKASFRPRLEADHQKLLRLLVRLKKMLGVL